ncbi:hypothetical protein CLOM_g15780 [Closterium sp. NIES-68]|nr:hypothetical protein CLOM_g15780 [Closterium sp. NIES-68]
MATSTSFLPSAASLLILRSTSALRLSIASPSHKQCPPCPAPADATVVRAASYRQAREPWGPEESPNVASDWLSQENVSRRPGEQGERQRSGKSAEGQPGRGSGKKKAPRNQEGKENGKAEVPIRNDRKGFRRRRGFKWKRNIEGEGTAPDGVTSTGDGVSSSSSSSGGGRSSGSSSFSGGERKTRSDSKASLPIISVFNGNAAGRDLSDDEIEEWEDLHGPVGFEFGAADSRIRGGNSSRSSSSSNSSGSSGSSSIGLDGAVLMGDEGLQGDRVREPMRLGEAGENDIDDVWTHEEALTWGDAGRADWSDTEEWGGTEEWGNGAEWGDKEMRMNREKWGDTEELKDREEWGDTEKWRGGGDRGGALEAKAQSQVRSEGSDLPGLVFADQRGDLGQEEQHAGLPYAVGLASVQQPLDLLWEEELMGEEEKVMKTRVVDLGRLKEKLERFCEEQGLEPGTMPTRGILRAARRSDIEKDIQFAGGVHAVALRLSVQVARKPRGYWDDPANLKQEVHQFQAEFNLPSNKMPSRRLLQKHGRGDLARTFEKWGGLHEVARMLGLTPRFKQPRKPRSDKAVAAGTQSDGNMESKVTSGGKALEDETEGSSSDKREKVKKDYPIKAAVPNKSKKWYSITIEETSDEETEL